MIKSQIYDTSRTFKKKSVGVLGMCGRRLRQPGPKVILSIHSQHATVGEVIKFDKRRLTNALAACGVDNLACDNERAEVLRRKDVVVD